VSDGGEFPAVGHKLGTFFRVGAKDPVIRASHERVFGLVVRLVAIPDPLKADGAGLIVFRQRYIGAVTFTIDVAAETDVAGRVLCENMAAKAAGIEIAGATTYLIPRANV
jgi:hypothetical protein